MSLTTYWFIDSLSTYPQHEGQVDVVFKINWRGRVRWIADEVDETGRQESFQSERYMSTEVEYKNGDQFTPYSDLTAEAIWAWVDDRADRSALEQEMKAEIDGWRNPQTFDRSPPFEMSLQEQEQP